MTKSKFIKWIEKIIKMNDPDIEENYITPYDYKYFRGFVDSLSMLLLEVKQGDFKFEGEEKDD